MFHDDLQGGSKAYEKLLDYVESNFSTAITDQNLDHSKKVVHNVPTPPIYLQRPHHSLTIVGVEVRNDGSRNLLVFDPAYNTTKAMRMAILESAGLSRPESLLKPYRRGKKELKRFKAFEILRLTAPSTMGHE